jgi:hypothetical protein
MLNKEQGTKNNEQGTRNKEHETRNKLICSPPFLSRFKKRNGDYLILKRKTCLTSLQQNDTII